jgi:hypothetical protein
MTIDLATAFADKRMRYLIDANPRLYVELEKKGELKAHLLETGRQAAQMYETLEKQMLEEGRIPAHQIPLIVEEIVLNDIVFA